MLLDALDIDPADRAKLGNILDHTHTAKVSVIDIVNGLQRLRGGFSRGDIISIDLVCQGIQQKLDRVLGLMQGSDVYEYGEYVEEEMKEEPTLDEALCIHHRYL